MPPMSINTSSSREWLESDGLGGFASKTIIAGYPWFTDWGRA
jgi:glycogen debranching enzyme